MRSLHRAGRMALVAATAVLALGVTASAASASTMASNGQLRWTMQNSYTLGCSAPPGLNCTWLGYLTNPAPGPASAKGTASTENGAVGTTVSPTSPRGAGVLYTFGFPFNGLMSSGPVYTGGGSDEFEFDGTLKFFSPPFVPPPGEGGHGFTMTIEDPLVTLAGDGTGALYASGLGQGTTATYDRSEPVFDLDLTTATIETDADGTQTIGPIVPSIHEGDYAFPGEYPTDSGPNRAPNIFGSFTLVLNEPEGGGGQFGPPGPQGEKGDTGEAGARGATGVPGVSGARGKQGKQGKRGPQGKSGKSATGKKKNKKGKPGRKGKPGKKGKKERAVRRATISLR